MVSGFNWVFLAHGLKRMRRAEVRVIEYSLIPDKAEWWKMMVRRAHQSYGDDTNHAELPKAARVGGNVRLISLDLEMLRTGSLFLHTFIQRHAWMAWMILLLSKASEFH
jgi:hypothetical protein